VAGQIQGTDVKVRGKPWGKKVKPVGMGGAAVKTQNWRPAGGTVVEVMQPQSPCLNHMARIRSWLEATRWSLNRVIIAALTQVR
jgi:hypothetical protein